MLTAADLEEQLDQYEKDLKDDREKLQSIRHELGQRSPEEQQQWRLKEKSAARDVELTEGVVKVTQRTLENLFPKNAERRRCSKAQNTRISMRIDVFSNVKNMWHTWCRSRRDGYAMLDDSNEVYR